MLGVALLAALGSACRDQPAVEPVIHPDSSISDEDSGPAPARDAAAPIDAPKDAVDAPMSIASGCPAPPVVTPADVPPAYLPAVEVTLVRPTDGDTAHFYFPGSGEQIVRFLHINTEESYGPETTAFGIETKEAVAAFLTAAHTIHVAPQDSWRMPGTPRLDPYGRWLGIVFVDGELLETRIVREGWSAYYTEFGCAPEPIHSSLLYAEAEANAGARGIWEPGHPTDYRAVFDDWIGADTCRPNPYVRPYCAAP